MPVYTKISFVAPTKKTGMKFRVRVIETKMCGMHEVVKQDFLVNNISDIPPHDTEYVVYDPLIPHELLRDPEHPEVELTSTGMPDLIGKAEEVISDIAKNPIEAIEGAIETATKIAKDAKAIKKAKTTSSKVAEIEEAIKEAIEETDNLPGSIL